MNIEKQIDILLQTIDRYWGQAVQQENQRANFANYILLLTGATQGYIIQREYDRFSISLSVIIFILGLFGLLMTAKYYERFSEQTAKVGRLMEKLKEIEPNVDLDELENNAYQKHKNRFKLLSKIRLNWLWILFFSFFALLGIIDICIIVFGWYLKTK
jgi:hypothetical protein